MTQIRRLVGPALLLLVLGFAVYAGIWLFEAREIRTGIRHAASPPLRSGVRLAAEHVAIGGFPFSLQVRLDQVTITGSGPAGTSLQSPQVIAEGRALLPEHWHLRLPKGLEIHLPIHLPATLSDGWVITAAAATGSIDRAGGAESGTVIALEAQQVQLAGPVPTTAAETSLRLLLPDHPPVDHNAAALDIDLVAHQVHLSQPVPPFGDAVDAITVQSSIQGAIPSGGVSAALRQWRDAGGTFEIHKLRLDWQKLHLAADGTLALDNDLQPIGAFSAVVSGWESILESMVAAGQLKRQEAQYAALGLTLLSHPNAEGSQELTAPVSLQNGGIYLGPARLARLPTFTWP